MPEDSSIYENVSIVIPTNRDEIQTLQTIPDTAEVVVRRDDGLNVARNAGVRAASNEWVVICDDDIDFPATTVRETIEDMDNRTLAGLADFPPLRWIIGRLMIFHVSLWETVGGFDESRHHGGDTDFAIRVEKNGGTVRRLDRESVPHYDIDTGESMSWQSHLEWLFYLTRHPRIFAPIAVRIIARKIKRTVT